MFAVRWFERSLLKRLSDESVDFLFVLEGLREMDDCSVPSRIL